MKVRFWGVRGSIPAPVPATAIEQKLAEAIRRAPPDLDRADPDAVRAFVRSLPPLLRGTAGGNTSCVEVRSAGAQMIIDAGSGLRSLGLELMKGPCGRGQGELAVLFSHPHWDHLQGFPFFVPGFVPGNRITIYSVHDLRAALEGQQAAIYFPVPLSVMRAHLEFVRIRPGEPFVIGDVTVTAMLNSHPGDAYSFRLEDRHSVFVFASDAEYKNLLDPEAQQQRRAFFSNADALVFDAQYTLVETWQKEDWGHSSALIGVDLARDAGVKRLLLFHHDPTNSDEQLLSIQAQAIAYQAQDAQRPPCEILIAHEGLELDLVPDDTMDLQLLRENATAVLTPFSSFGARGVDRLVEQLDQLAAQSAPASAIVDLAHVETLTTPVLRALVMLARARPGSRLLLSSPSPAVQEVIRLSGYGDAFTVYPSVANALEAVQLREALDLPGAVLAKRYRIERAIGALPLGSYLSATDLQSSAAVTVTLLAPTFSHEAQERLLRNTARLISLDHPALVRLHAIERERDILFLVADPPPRRRLAALLDERELSVDEALHLADDLTAALAYIHSCGVVHGNLSFWNIFLTENGIRLSDVGLGRLEEGRRLLDVPPLILAPTCVAPEQIVGQSLDTYSDLYALGVILYRLFTGRLPFSGADVAVMQAHLEQQPTAPRDLNPVLSLGLDHLILKLLAKNPNERYASAQQVHEVLGSLAVGGSDAARRDPALLVGRNALKKQLLAAWELVRSGSGRMAFISGEAGIGKSHLLHALAADVPDAVRLIGQCHEQSDSAEYFPFRTILSAYLATLPPELHAPELQTCLAAITELVPDVVRYVPELPALPELEPRQEQLRVLSSVTHLIAQAARRRPWILMLENLHWADQSTIELLRYLGRQTPGMPLLLIGTFRDTELDEDHVLRHALRELGRFPGYDNMVLERLDQAGVAELLAVQWGMPAPNDLTELIYRQTEGNPLYVETIARELREEGALTQVNGTLAAPAVQDVRLPSNVRDAVWRRIRRLSPDTQTLLRTASVLGPVFQFEHLRAMSDLPEWEILEHLDMALERRLLQEVAGGSMLRFSHAEIHAVLYADQGAFRRRGLHRLAAEVIEQQAGEHARLYAAELAHHSIEASEWERALEYTTEAARQAAAVYANERALQWYNRALTTLDHLERTGAADMLARRLEIEQKTTMILELIGRWEAAHGVYDRALSLAEATSARQVLARLQAYKGNLLRLQSRYIEARAWLQRALASFEALQDDPGIAQACAFLGAVERESGALDLAEQYYLRSLAVQRRLGERAGLSQTLNLMAALCSDRGDVVQATALLQEALALYGEERRQPLVARLLSNLGFLATQQGDYMAAQRYLEESLALAQAMGDTQQLGSTLHHLAVLAQAEGSYPVAWQHFMTAFRLVQELGDRFALADLLEDLSRLVIAQGDHVRALHLAGAAAALRERIQMPNPPRQAAHLKETLAPAYQALGAETDHAAYLAGYLQTPEQVLLEIIPAGGS